MISTKNLIQTVTKSVYIQNRTSWYQQCYAVNQIRKQENRVILND